MYQLNDKRLLRICNNQYKDETIRCEMKGNKYSNSFEVLHCPCYGDNCILILNNQTIDIENINIITKLEVNGHNTITNNKGTTYSNITLNGKLTMIGDDVIINNINGNGLLTIETTKSELYYISVNKIYINSKF